MHGVSVGQARRKSTRDGYSCSFPMQGVKSQKTWRLRGDYGFSILLKQRFQGLSPCRSLMISARRGSVLSTPLKSAFSEVPPCRHSPADSHLLPPSPFCAHSSEGRVKWVKNSTTGSCLQGRWFALCLWWKYFHLSFPTWLLKFSPLCNSVGQAVAI